MFKGISLDSLGNLAFRAWWSKRAWDFVVGYRSRLVWETKGLSVSWVCAHPCMSTHKPQTRSSVDSPGLPLRRPCGFSEMMTDDSEYLNKKRDICYLQCAHAALCLRVSVFFPFLGSRWGQCNCAGDIGRHFLSSCNYWWKLCSAGFRSWRKWSLLDGMKNEILSLVLLNVFTFNILYVLFVFYHWL